MHIAERSLERATGVDAACARHVADVIHCFDRALHEMNRRQHQFPLLLPGGGLAGQDPRFDVDLEVEAESMALAEWHLGRVKWNDALRTDRIRVAGPSRLGRMLPRWNRRSAFAMVQPVRS